MRKFQPKPSNLDATSVWKLQIRKDFGLLRILAKLEAIKVTHLRCGRGVPPSQLLSLPVQNPLKDTRWNGVRSGDENLVFVHRDCNFLLARAILKILCAFESWDAVLSKSSTILTFHRENKKLQAQTSIHFQIIAPFWLDFCSILLLAPKSAQIWGDPLMFWQIYTFFRKWKLQNFLIFVTHASLRFILRYSDWKFIE